ncbi:MAG: helix-turn-helix transcriptional regulator [Clostridia bacterium]|nr:helix-turn-helix transcriptional regulator [Clostridia bacterium]
MEKPFILIDCRLTRREEFTVTDGTQPTWALLYIKEGSFELDFGDGKQTIAAGDTVIFDDSISFRRNVVQPIVFVYLRFRVNMRCPFALDVPVGKIEFADKERFLSTLHAYEAVMALTDRRVVYYKEHLLEDILFQLFLESMKPSETQLPAATGDEQLNRAIEYIRSHMSRDLHINTICQAVHTNPSTLNWRFQRGLGMSVGAFVNDTRMNWAKRLLISTTFSISDIAVQCGYDNVYYFSTAFKKKYGMPPTAFRRDYE